MRARSYFKRIAILVSVVLILCVCVVVIALFSLPDIGDIRSGFSIFRREPLQPPSVNVTTSGTTNEAPPAPSPATDLSPPPLPANAVTAAPNANPVTDYLINRFVDEGDTTVRACDNMGDTTATPPRNPQELEQQLIALAETRFVENPFIESAIAPFGAVLSRPDVGEIVDEIRNARETGDTSFISKAQFYALAADVAASLFADQTSLELVSQHAYHLYVLSKATQIAPEMLTDDGFAGFCEELEAKISAVAAGGAPETLEEAIQIVQLEKSDMLQLLSTYGLTPAQVGYNPNMPMNVRFQASLERVALTSPWMSREFGTSVSLSGRPPAQQPQQQQAQQVQPQSPSTGAVGAPQPVQQPVGDQPAQDQPNPVTPGAPDRRGQQPTTQSLPPTNQAPGTRATSDIPANTQPSEPTRAAPPVQPSPPVQASPARPLPRVSPASR